MIKDLIISTFLAILYLLSVMALTILTVNTLNFYVDLFVIDVSFYVLFGLFYAFVAYNVYYEPILDTI